MLYSIYPFDRFVVRKYGFPISRDVNFESICMTDGPTIVKCPTCRVDVVWQAANEYRPFCSQRCKLIDLGEWAQERYVVAAEEDDTLSDALKL